MLAPVRTGPPAALLDLTEVKAFCRVDFDDDDTILSALMQAAVDHLDGWSGVMGRCLVEQDWRVDQADWTDTIRLPFPDVSSVTVKYFDTDNTEQTVASSLYELLTDARGSYVHFLDDFTAPDVYDDRSDAVRVTFTAGFGDADAVPDAIKIAAMMLVAHWYENREAVAMNVTPNTVPMAVDSLIAPYRYLRV